MKNIFLLSLLLRCALSFGAEGVVVVVEAPMFRVPDKNSPVVQYAKKGQRVYIHPVVTNDREAYDIRPSKKALERQKTRDDLFLKVKPEVQNFHDNYPFILTKDNQGRDAWMIREHVYVWYEDAREFAQSLPTPDPTDYRLLEPLPSAYPFNRSETLRANMRLSLGTPLTQNYPYRERIQADSYGYQFEFNAQMTRRVRKEASNRLYAGGLFTFRTVNSDLTLETRRSREQWNKIGFGGVLTYDPYRTDLHRITLSWAAIINPFHQVSISQTDLNGVTEIRNFLAWNFSSRVGAEWQWLRVTETLDLTMGVYSELESPLNFNSSTPSNRPEWWSGDQFNSAINFTLAGFVGLQSAY